MTFRLRTGSGPLRAVLVGDGFRARQWADALRSHPEVRFLGAASTDPAELLAADGAELLVNCATADQQSTATVAALERGAAVVVARPAVESLKGTRALVEVADRAEQLLMFGQYQRSRTQLSALRGRLAELGPLALVHSEFRLPRRAAERGNAWRDPLLRELAVPFFDTVRAVTGCEPVTVSCAGEDSATAVFEMPGGLRYLFTGDWSTEGPPTCWSGRWHAVGERGSARWGGGGPQLGPGGRTGAAVGAVGSGAAVGAVGAAPVPPGAIEPLQAAGPAAVLTDAIAALRTGAPPPGECHDYLLTLAMLEAAVGSACSGRPAAVSPATVLPASA